MEKYLKPCEELATFPGVAKLLSESQLGSALPTHHHHLDKQVEEPHAVHSFEWCFNDQPSMLTCNKAGTVENLLRRSGQFREIAGKNKKRELVIMREGKAISSHFPCSLIKDTRLTVKYIKPVDKLKHLAENLCPVDPRSKWPSDKLVMFHLLTAGGKKVKKIMRNPLLKRNVEEITIYAYKGEKVKQALKRDGRLLNIMFKKNCVLSDTSSGVKTEMSNLVDELDGKTFKVILLNKSSPPDSQSSSLDDAYTMQNEPQMTDSDGNQDPPQQSTTTESGSDSTPEEEQKLNGKMTPDKIFSEIPCSKGTKTRIQDFFPVEYGKNAQTCREVKTMKKLMELSNSVCHVRINGRPGGSGFLLFDKFVLTNGHVVKNIHNESTGQLYERVTVHFSYESLEQMEPDAEVDEVTGFEYCTDVSGRMYDWALLRLDADLKLPDVLLTHFGFPYQSGVVFIIGHTGGDVKKIDQCNIIPFDKVPQIVEEHLHKNPGSVGVQGSHYGRNEGYIEAESKGFFEFVTKSVKEKAKEFLYESCLYFGSSGSPVFDKHCNVVAMHSGGYPYYNASGIHSVIEYGYPLSDILEHMIVQFVERGKIDLLKKYLASTNVRHQTLLTSLKKLVGSRNLTVFINAASNSVATSDENLKNFFEFISQKEEPDPMETD